jgi:hypothetical protein
MDGRVALSFGADEWVSAAEEVAPHVHQSMERDHRAGR